MNAVSFTQSFDACVGHAKQVNEKYKGHEIDLEETSTGQVAYYVDGRRGLLRTTSVDDARRAAREVVDNMEKERKK